MMANEEECSNEMLELFENSVRATSPRQQAIGLAVTDPVKTVKMRRCL